MAEDAPVMMSAVMMTTHLTALAKSKKPKERDFTIGLSSEAVNCTCVPYGVVIWRNGQRVEITEELIDKVIEEVSLPPLRYSQEY